MMIRGPARMLLVGRLVMPRGGGLGLGGILPSVSLVDYGVY